MSEVCNKLTCEMIWKIWKKGKLKCEMIWKIWKKSTSNSEKIWKIQKKIVKDMKNMDNMEEKYFFRKELILHVIYLSLHYALH